MQVAIQKIETVRDLLQKRAQGQTLNFAERNIVNIYNKKKRKFKPK